MKKTTSMIYTPSHEARELYVYTINCGRVGDYMNAIEENLRKKIRANKYDSEKALGAFYNLACEGSRMYGLDFGYTFDVTARYTAAVDMRNAFELDELEA